MNERINELMNEWMDGGKLITKNILLQNNNNNENNEKQNSKKKKRFAFLLFLYNLILQLKLFSLISKLIFIILLIKSSFLKNNKTKQNSNCLVWK